MGATTKRYDTTPAETSRLRGGVVDYLMGSGQGASGFGTRGNGTGSPYDRINAATVNPTQSLDEISTGDFMKNIMGQLQPGFDQERRLAVAGANEGSGTLTGSGFANTLGKAVGRSLTDEQRLLTGYATHGLDLEAQRQAQRYGTESDMASRNASNFLQLLLGQSLAGVGPDTIKTSGGIGALLGPLVQLFGMYKGAQGGGGGEPPINIPAYVPPPNIPSNFPTYRP